MTAKEMFEELGYRKVEWSFKELAFQIEKENESFNWRRIEFNEDNKTLIVVYRKFNYGSLNMEEYKAIQKQIEELGWE